MEQKLSNQERAKIIAMYYPLSPVSKIPYPSTTYSNIAAIEMCFMKQEGYEDIVLPLKKLEAITDEHAIEVAKIAARRPEHYSLKDADITRHENSIDIIFLDELDNVINISFPNGDVLFYEHDKNGNRAIHQRTNGQAKYIDLIRELSYALPYKGIDLFKAGIAIDKTSNN